MIGGPFLHNSWDAGSRTETGAADALCGARDDGASPPHTAVAPPSAIPPEISDAIPAGEYEVGIPTDMWSLRLELEYIGRRAAGLVHSATTDSDPIRYRWHASHLHPGQTHLCRLGRGERLQSRPVNSEASQRPTEWAMFLIALGCLVCGLTVLGWGFVLREPQLLYFGIPITATGSALLTATWFLQRVASHSQARESGISRQERSGSRLRRAICKKLNQPAGYG